MTEGQRLLAVWEAASEKYGQTLDRLFEQCDKYIFQENG